MCACVCLCVRVCACVSVCTGVKPPYRGGVVAGDGHQKSTSPAEGRESQSLAGEVLQTLDREGLQDINAGITRTHRHTHIPRPGRTDTHKRARTDTSTYPGQDAQTHTSGHAQTHARTDTRTYPGQDAQTHTSGHAQTDAGGQTRTHKQTHTGTEHTQTHVGRHAHPDVRMQAGTPRRHTHSLSHVWLFAILYTQSQNYDFDVMPA